MKRLNIEVATLQETEYTGVPQVTAKLCEQLLGDSSVEPGFFYNRQAVSRQLVEYLLRERTGAIFRWAAERYRLYEPFAMVSPDDEVVGLHTNMKFARRIFPVEGQIIHDLTTILTPQYHTEETNRYHREKLFGDLMSNDVTFCVSRSTAADVKTLYPDLPGPIVVSHLGVDWTHIDDVYRAMTPEVENYILVLGTLEPRKNIRIVLDLLAERPQLARMYRFVFVGRVGWGDSFETQVETRGMDRLLAEGRIVKTGFVSETAKYMLLKFASAVIYPSLYEGFGLPVAEALSFGTPVVTTASSSIPEVGQSFAQYFDPDRLGSLGDALNAALRQGRIVGDQFDDGLAAWRHYFSWPRCYSSVRDSLMTAADEVGRRRRVHN